MFVRSLFASAIAFSIFGCEAIDSYLDIPALNVPSQSTGTAASAAQSAATAQMEARVRQQINRIRQQQNLSELRQNDRLAEVARAYSRRMATEHFFSHTSPSGDSMVQRVQAAKIRYFVLGENLFRGTNLPNPVNSAVQGWMQSPGHRENIVRPEFRETGIGVWRVGNTYYFTQLFLRWL